MMTIASQCVRACLLVALLAIPTLRVLAVNAAPVHLFNDCAYQAEMSALTGGTSRLFAALWKLPTPQFQQQESALLTQLSRINARYGSVHHKEARLADAALRGALSSASAAVDGRDAGVYDVWTSKMKVAYADVNTVSAALKTFCALGHPAHTQLAVSLTGYEYPDGISPMPVAPPWLSLTKNWTLRWSYVCRNVPNGFRVEVRSVRGSLSGIFGETSVYLGPVMATPVAQNGGGGSGTAYLRGFPGPLYLVVRTRCASTVKVVG
ncbi:MAG: hypothetical protein NVS2B16_03490 [Chloroflexota bacterium]